jgi:quercetin dioxygenase-like cupin family protein
MKTLQVVLGLSLGFAGMAAADDKEHKGAGAGAAAPGAHIMVNAKDLKWTDAPPTLPKGAKIAVLEGDMKEGPFTLRVQFPAKYKVMPHTHPTMEHVTVLSGSVNMGMGEKLDEKAATKLPVGGFSAMPANTAHYLFTNEKAVVQVHGMAPFVINYVDPKDDPRNQAATAPTAK